MKSHNGFLAVEPFKERVIESKTQNAFATIKQKVNLTPLAIVYGSEKFPSGTVWVHGAIQATPYAREVYELGVAKPFILIPEGEVRLHQNG